MFHGIRCDLIYGFYMAFMEIHGLTELKIYGKRDSMGEHVSGCLDS